MDFFFFFSPFLFEGGDCKYFKACLSVKVFTQPFANLTCLYSVVNLEWNISQKPDPKQESRNYKQLPKIGMFSAENSICPRRFTWDGPEGLRTCSTCMSIPRPYLRGMLFICAEYIGSFVGFLRIHVHISRRRVSNHNLVWELHPSATPPLLLLFSIE